MQDQVNNDLEDYRDDWVDRGDVPAKKVKRGKQHPDVEKAAIASRSGKGHGSMCTAANHVQRLSAEPSTTCVVARCERGGHAMAVQAAALKRKPAAADVRGEPVAPGRSKAPRSAR